MSKRAPNVSVLTANRLADGLAVFLTADGTWVESVAGAALARTPEEAEALTAAGVRDSARNLVVEPYLAEVAETGTGLLPQRVRERVRVEGPSILADVPGYVPPSSLGRGEGRGEGQPDAPVPGPVAPPRPNPLRLGTGRADASLAPSIEAA
jgi:hypothetical protein